MTLLEYCKSIPDWGQFISDGPDTYGNFGIWVNLSSLTYEYMGGIDLAFEYFNAVMENILPCEYYMPSIKHDPEVWIWSEHRIKPSDAKLLTTYSIIIDEPIREFSTSNKLHFKALGKNPTRIPEQEIERLRYLYHLINSDGSINKSGKILAYEDTTIYKLINDTIKIIQTYENLDLFIGISKANTESFLDNLVLGIHIQDQIIGFESPSRARNTFEKYLEVVPI